MAARKRRGTLDSGWDDTVRQRIKAGFIIEKLQDHIMGQVNMTATQVTAALGLLKKALPDLQAVEHSGEVENTQYVISDQPEPQSHEEWLARYKPH